MGIGNDDRAAVMGASAVRSRPPNTHGFSLIELLVTIAVIAVLVGILAAALSGTREAGRGAVCLSNLRGIFAACRIYADDNKGLSPALGVPYTALPNWALVVQEASGRSEGTSAAYANRSALVCPTTDAAYPVEMVRTYAVNVTGHAGLAGDETRRADPDNYDVSVTHIRMDAVELPSATVLVIDSAAAGVSGDAPPPTRTASVIDFRQPDHVQLRLGRIHARRTSSLSGDGGSGADRASGRFQFAAMDGSARPGTELQSGWLDALP